MPSIKRSVSSLNASRSSPSNSGYTSSTGVEPSSRRSSSHWAEKLSTSARDRGSLSIRLTCASSTVRSRNRPFSARPSNSSSGMLLHRKNDSRDARSMSLSRDTPADFGGVSVVRLAGASWRTQHETSGCRRHGRNRTCRRCGRPLLAGVGTRNRKCGLVRMRSMPALDAAVETLRQARAAEPHQRLHLAVVHRTPIGAAGDAREDLRGTRLELGFRRRPAREDLLAAGALF